LQNARAYSYIASNYRYSRGGTYYETNQYGVSQLQQAARNGYEEGVRAGQADRQDGYRSSPQDSFAYQDAAYGYDSYYVDLSEYNYYFREGFRRGYEDGYNGRWQYGSYSNGGFSLLGNVLQLIFNAQRF